MHERCDHNRFAEQLAARLREPDQNSSRLGTWRCKRCGALTYGDYCDSCGDGKRLREPSPIIITASPRSNTTNGSTTTMSSLFQPAEVTSAFMKLGLLGFQGSGKTKTASKVTIGLVNHMREHGIAAAGKPVKFLDTEIGSDWVIPDFKAAGIRLDAAKTRAFSDLLIAVDEAEANGSALIIDSITHFWMELTQSYMKKKNRTRLQFEDWAVLKAEWGKFTDRFVNSSAHIALCGRAGFEYDYTVDEETQKKNLEKTGVKMKAEGEMGYEPSLLVLMERQQEIEGSKIKRVWRTATILKDRSARLDGQSFEDPGFEEFLPHIQMLNLGGRQLGVDTSRTSEHMITVDKRDWQPVQREICIDEIQTLLSLRYPSQSADDKKNKLKAILAHFDATWTEIEKVMPLTDLRAGYDSLHRALEDGKPSKYAAILAPKATTIEINDSLPGDLAPPAATTTTTPAIDTTTVGADGIPKFLKRTDKPAVAPAEPTPSAFDEPRWLAELTRAFEDCGDVATLGARQVELMLSKRKSVTAAAWKKAEKLARTAFDRLMNQAETDPIVQVAAE